jgi:hypothetical protein
MYIGMTHFVSCFIEYLIILLKYDRYLILPPDVH